MKRKTRSSDDKPEEPKKPQKVGPNPPGIDYRSHPEQYKVARGEQGVLTVEPYKSEILPHWRFRWAYILQLDRVEQSRTALLTALKLCCVSGYMADLNQPYAESSAAKLHSAANTFAFCTT